MVIFETKNKISSLECRKEKKTSLIYQQQYPLPDDKLKIA